MSNSSRAPIPFLQMLEGVLNEARTALEELDPHTAEEAIIHGLAMLSTEIEILEQRPPINDETEELPAADEKPKRKGKPVDFWADARLAAKYGIPVVAVLGVVFVIYKVISGIYQQALASETITRPTMNMQPDMGPVINLINTAVLPLVGMAAFISIAISIAFWVIGLIWKSGE